MASNTHGIAPIEMVWPSTRVPFRFFRSLRTSPVTTQQIPTVSRKSLTLLQLLGLIGAAGLIAAIVLNQFV
ncbi:hypothetical protein R69888_03687 [Paraburkholderia haematera]|uniref:Uncharacterized protein n=1 Tax=Paraburkholderia haematera TaxID=2793077 RepID=A0ABM8RR74_9BURK|nr:hypothetical protein R69888_03687 [Paraburkholderia haematera]